MDLPATVTGPGSSFLESLQLPSIIANTQANTALQGAQGQYYGAETQGQNLQNQWTQAQLAGLPGLLGGSGNGSAPPTSPTPTPVGGAGVMDADIENAAQRGFAPLPNTPPPAVMDRALGATILYKNPAAGDLIKQQYTAQVDAQNKLRAQGADQAYINAQTVATAPAGSAFAVLKRLAPQLADQLEQMHEGDTPAQLDADTRLYAQHWGLQVHQYGTRGTTMNNGTLIDGVDNKPVLGSEQVLTGLDSGQKQQAYEYATAQIDVPLSNGQTAKMPRWQAPVSAGGLGGVSPEQYVMRADRAARTSANSQPTPPMLSRGAPSAPAAPQPTPAKGPQPTAGVTDLAAATPNPLPKGPPRAGISPSTSDQANWQDYNKQAHEMDQQAGAAVTAANSQIQGANNAQIALQKAMTGSAGDRVAAFQTLLGNPAFLRPLLGDPQSRQVLTKVLGNDAIMDIEKEAQGSSFRLGATTMNAALNKLAASADMTPQAIVTMTNAIKANARYDAQKWGPDYRAYKAAGGDVIAYDGVYSSKYPNRSTINPADLSGSGRPTITRMGTVNGQRVAQYSDGSIRPL